MTQGGYEVLAGRIGQELQNIALLTEELKKKGLWEKQHLDEADSFTLRAVGSVLHDFYVAVENVFELIAREVDGTLPQEPEWHLALLKQMAIPLATTRPAVIEQRTLEALNEYRAFRHVFRHVYGFSLSYAKLEPLLAMLPAATEALARDLQSFIYRMRDIAVQD